MGQGLAQSPTVRGLPQHAGGDREKALELYEWNTQLSAAVVHDIAHFEVGLRNAYDQALTAHLGLPNHWTALSGKIFAPVLRVKKRRTPAGVFRTRIDVNQKMRSSLERAVREAGGPTAPPGKVIAQLNLGFWRYLTSAAHEVSIWRPALHHAYVTGTSRVEVDGPIGRLHEIRNRIAHHEPLLSRDVGSLHDDLLNVAGLLSPNLSAYIRYHSKAQQLLNERP